MFDIIEQKGFKRIGLLSMTAVLVLVSILTAWVYSLSAKSLFLDVVGLEEQVKVVTPELLEEKPPEIAKEKPKAVQNNSSSPVKEVTRQDNVQNIMESPRDVPNKINIDNKNIPRSRPLEGSYKLGKVDSDGLANNLPNGDNQQDFGIGDPNGNSNNTQDGEDAPPTTIKTPTPKPVATATPTPKPVETPKPKLPTIQSKGVINGSAVYLPQIPYPIAAKAVRAQGTVAVRVLIDEQGSVVNILGASGGHKLLHPYAISAAKQARFRPTLLSGTPVKVEGTINFVFRLD